VGARFGFLIGDFGFATAIENLKSKIQNPKSKIGSLVKLTGRKPVIHPFRPALLCVTMGA
jgi:hypothetical protein